MICLQLPLSLWLGKGMLPKEGVGMLFHCQDCLECRACYGREGGASGERHFAPRAVPNIADLRQHLHSTHLLYQPPLLLSFSSAPDSPTDFRVRGLDLGKVISFKWHLWSVEELPGDGPCWMSLQCEDHACFKTFPSN